MAQNHDARKAVLSTRARRAVSITLSVFKLSGAIFRPRSSTPSFRSFYLCPFHWKLTPSGVTLESLGLENIPQVPANRAKVAQNHDARKAVSITLSVLKSSGTIFRPKSLTRSVRSFYLCLFHWKQRPLGVSLESSGQENIPPIPTNRAKVAKNHDARKAVSATL